jgi:hypothetical protein
MGDAFGAALLALDYRATGAVVLTGAGRAFSAGGDLAFLRARAQEAPLANAARMRAFYARFLRPLRACRVPVVAAVHGAAIGAGAALATAADVRCVAAGARVGFSFPQLGIHAGMGSTHFLPRAVGPGAAARLLLTGDAVGDPVGVALGVGAPESEPVGVRAWLGVPERLGVADGESDVVTEPVGEPDGVCDGDAPGGGVPDGVAVSDGVPEPVGPCPTRSTTRCSTAACRRSARRRVDARSRGSG